MKKIKIIALVAALVLAFCVYKYMGILSQPAELPRTNVVVCAVDVPANTTITAEMVKTEAIITESVLPNAVTDVSEVVGMVMNSDMVAGEQVISNRLVRLGASDATSDSLAYVVQPGMRAVTINVSTSSGLANMLRPGNRVDVVAYYSYAEEAPNAGSAESEQIQAAKLLMQNVQVLAVDTNIRNGAVDVDGYGTVTLELDPAQAVEISFTEQYCALRLILRSSVDDAVVAEEEIILDTIRE